MMTTKTNEQDTVDVHRSFRADDIRSGEDNTIIFPLSSEAKVRRFFYSYGQELDEVLRHSEAAVDLTFLNSGTAPVLDSHKRYGGLERQIGVIKKAWLEGKRIYVEIKFSRKQFAQDVANDVRDGIVKNVSVGYDIIRHEVDEKKGTWTATRWKPNEASFVSIPADATVGMGRSAERKDPPMDPAKTPAKAGNDDITLPGAEVTQERSADERGKALETSINEIIALGQTHNMANVARSYIDGHISRGSVPSLGEFKGIARSKLPDAKPLDNKDIGLTERETQSFSIVRLAQHMAGLATDEDAAFELEASRAARDNGTVENDHGGIIIPTDVMERWSDFQVDGVRYDPEDERIRRVVRAAMATSGNPNILTTDHLAGSFIDNLRNMSSILRAGVTVMEGLDSDVEIPGGDQNSSAFWLAAEDDDVAETNPTFRKITLAPRDLGAFTDLTRRMLQQSTIAIEAYARAQLVDAHRLEIDRAGLYGTGANGQPTGLLNTTGIGSVVFAAQYPTREEVIDVRAEIAETNRGTGVQQMGNSLFTAAMQKQRTDPGSGIFLMNDSAERLVGNPYLESNQIVDGDFIAGVFSDFLMGLWGGLQLDRSTEAKFLSGGVRLRSIQTVDFACARVGSFVYGADAP